jgi:hypothetical protein
VVPLEAQVYCSISDANWSKAGAHRQRGKRMGTTRPSSRSLALPPFANQRSIGNPCPPPSTCESLFPAWSEERGVRLEFIQPGKPAQNAFAESFNGRLRDECLNANWFTSLSDARRKIEDWRQDYKQQRPHSSLSYLPPAEFARQQLEMGA